MFKSHDVLSTNLLKKHEKSGFFDRRRRPEKLGLIEGGMSSEGGPSELGGEMSGDVFV